MRRSETTFSHHQLKEKQKRSTQEAPRQSNSTQHGKRAAACEFKAPSQSVRNATRQCPPWCGCIYVPAFLHQRTVLAHSHRYHRQSGEEESNIVQLIRQSLTQDSPHTRTPARHARANSQSTHTHGFWSPPAVSRNSALPFFSRCPLDFFAELSPSTT